MGIIIIVILTHYVVVMGLYLSFHVSCFFFKPKHITIFLLLVQHITLFNIYAILNFRRTSSCLPYTFKVVDLKVARRPLSHHVAAQLFKWPSLIVHYLRCFQSSRQNSSFIWNVDPLSPPFHRKDVDKKITCQDNWKQIESLLGKVGYQV